MRRFTKLLLPLGVVLALAVVSWGLLTLANQPGRTATSAALLPAERAAHYDNLLRKSQRDEAYLRAPKETLVYEEVMRLLPKNATPAQTEAAVRAYYDEFHRKNNELSRPNPMAYLGRLKAKEAAELSGNGTTPPLSGEPQVLTVMMNFAGVESYAAGPGGVPVLFNGVCLTDTTAYPQPTNIIIDGPSFNEVEQPDDNWTPWIPTNTYTGGFTQQYFTLLMYSTTGYTATMRPDVANPWDGGTGFDMTGSTFHNMYTEMSRGLYRPKGEVIETTLSEAASYYGAGACDQGVTGDGYWPRPRSTVAISAALQINEDYPGASTASNPSFNWADWDKEDSFDFDNDGNFQEPDGYVDHFFLIEAGEAEGGKYGEFLVWPHSSDIRAGQPGVGPAANQLGGLQVATDASHPLGGVWVLNYTVSDEVGGLGVLAHEYGHDIGLPDNYAVSGNGDANAGLWDLMSSGSFGGALAGMVPTHMTIWDKEFLGWNNPVQIDVTALGTSAQSGSTYQIGQQSKPPIDTVDGLRINLPDKESISSVTPFGTMMWYSDQADSRNESISHAFTAVAGEAVRVSAQLAYDIEPEYDYLFWEVSNDGGANWYALDVYSGTTRLSTDNDPNGGNSGNGIDGTSNGWVLAHADITPTLVGPQMSLRFRYFTDSGLQLEGIYLDNISVDGATSGNVLYDDAENGDSWTHESAGIETGHPWFIMNGTLLTKHYYLVEWRNSGGSGFDGPSLREAFNVAGFDAGLNQLYLTARRDSTGAIAEVNRFFMHTPGMLVWYVNGSYGDNSVGNHLADEPSRGSKGRVLVADANPYPYFYPSALTNAQAQVSDRRSAFDGAYSLTDRPPFEVHTEDAAGTRITATIPGDYAEPIFRDRLGVYPGIFTTPAGTSAYVDTDAGVVLPSRGNVPYWAAWELYGDTGQPGLNAYGINLEVVNQAANGTSGEVRFYLDDDTVFVDTRVSSDTVDIGEVVTYTIRLKDATGTRYADDFSWRFDAQLTNPLPAGATYVPGSLRMITDSYAYYDAPSATIASNTLSWTGQIGANPSTVPDAEMQFAVTFGQRGCYTSTSILQVTQQTITDTFRYNGAPFIWPQQSQYSGGTQVCVIDPTAVTVGQLESNAAGSSLPIALVGALAAMAGLALLRRRRG